MIYALYVAIGLAIFYLGYGIGREEMRHTLGRNLDSFYERKLAEQRKRHHITQPPKTANYDIEYHDMHKAVYRARIFPN